MADVAQLPVSPQVVGNAFVDQYYRIMHKSPGLVHGFYQDISKLGRPEENGSMSITTTLQAINEKIVSLNYGDFRVEIKSVDAQESHSGGVQVLVTGKVTGRDDKVRSFAQTFFLAPQDNGYFVLNDMFQFVDDINLNPALVNEVVAPVVPESELEVMAPPVQENPVPEQSPIAEEVSAGEVYDPLENGDVPIVEEEVPVTEVLDEMLVVVQKLVEPSAKIEEVPKKSYLSIVMDLKGTASFSPPPAAPRKAPVKKVEPVGPTSVAADVPVSSEESVDNGSNPEGEADGYSVYIGGLPMDATQALLKEVFAKFGMIKSDGIQVRNNIQQGFSFGFVEYEEASSMQKAVEASPLKIAGRQAYIEEKRSNFRGNNRGRRFVQQQPGRGSSGLRNEGVRGGRGNYGGGNGRGYNRGGGEYDNRGEFNGRNEYGNRGGDFNGNGRSEYGNRGGDFNGNGRSEYGYRGGDSNGNGRSNEYDNRGVFNGNRSGYRGRGSSNHERSDNNNFNSNGGGRLNRAGGMANGGIKSLEARVPVTA